MFGLSVPGIRVSTEVIGRMAHLQQQAGVHRVLSLTAHLSTSYLFKAAGAPDPDSVLLQRPLAAVALPHPAAL